MEESGSVFRTGCCWNLQRAVRRIGQGGGEPRGIAVVLRRRRVGRGVNATGTVGQRLRKDEVLIAAAD